MFKNNHSGRLASAIRVGGGLAVVLAIFAGAASALAQTTRVVTANFAPLTDNTSPDKKGLVHDLVKEMLKLQNIDKPIEFMVWSDAVKITDTEKGAVIFPMTRTPEREARYLWLTKVFDMNRSFATRPGGAPVDTIDGAKALKAVGTTSASASLTYLKQKGLTNIVEFKTSLDLMKSLLGGAVDAAYQPNPFAKADWKAAGGDGALVFGAVQETSAAYLAANKDSALNPGDWQGALQVLEQEGAFEKLVRDYGME